MIVWDWADCNCRRKVTPPSVTENVPAEKETKFSPLTICPSGVITAPGNVVAQPLRPTARAALRILHPAFADAVS
jgi:hypothetical protein